MSGTRKGPVSAYAYAARNEELMRTRAALREARTVIERQTLQIAHLKARLVEVVKRTRAAERKVAPCGLQGATHEETAA